MGWEMFTFTFLIRVHHLLISFIRALAHPQINSVMREEARKKEILFISSKMMMRELHTNLVGLC